MSKTEGCEIANTIEDAMKMAAQDEQAFIIGGARIYEQTIEKADRLIVTHVDLSVTDADRYFPKISAKWKAIEKSEVMNDDKSGISYQYITYSK